MHRWRVSDEAAGPSPGESPGADRDAGTGRAESAVSLLFAGARKAERAAYSARQGQAANLLFWGREKGVCSLARDRETKRTIAGGRYSRCGSADGAAWTAAGRKKEMTTRWKRFYQKQMEDA